jgi:hypothetical protein
LPLRRIVVSAALATIVLNAAPSLGQVNIERRRLERPSGGASAQLSASLSARTGNVDVTSLEAGGSARYAGSNRVVLLVFLGDYGWKDGERFSDQGLAHLRYTHGLTRRFALEAFVQGDYNGARLLDSRALAGGGVRATVIDEERAGLTVGTSYMFEHEEIDVPPGARHPAETDVWRWSSYAALRWRIGENAGASATGYAQPDVEDFEDVRVIAEGSLEARIREPVSLTVTFRIRHDSAPPDGIDDTDGKLTTGLAVSF